jgi:hypothetical protein
MIRGSNFELYVNGQLQGAGFRPFNPPTSTFSVGMNPQQLAGGFPAFFGKIDDVVAFKKNLEPTFIARLFSEGLTTHSNPLISDKNSFKIYPNPSNGKFSIEGKEIKEVKIFNLEGKDLSSSIDVDLLGNEAKFNSSNLKPGFYIVRVKNSEKYEYSRVSIF